MKTIYIIFNTRSPETTFSIFKIKVHKIKFTILTTSHWSRVSIRVPSQIYPIPYKLDCYGRSETLRNEIPAHPFLKCLYAYFLVPASTSALDLGPFPLL